MDEASVSSVVATWIGAIATTAAVVVALLGIRREAHHRRNAEVRERGAEAREQAAEARAQRMADDAAQSEREAQARTVAAWFAIRRGNPDDERASDGFPPLAVRELHVTNGSSLPVFGVQVQHWAHAPDQALRTPVDCPATIGPLERHTAPVKGTYSQGDVVIQFTDAAGRHWQRHESGRLTELSDEERWPGQGAS